MDAASAQIVMMPFDFAHGGREGERPEEGGERRNGRNTRVWHKKNLDTGMRRRERGRNKCGIAERSFVYNRQTNGEKSTKRYICTTSRTSRVVRLRRRVVRSVRLLSYLACFGDRDFDFSAIGSSRRSLDALELIFTSLLLVTVTHVTVTVM